MRYIFYKGYMKPI